MRGARGRHYFFGATLLHDAAYRVNASTLAGMRGRAALVLATIWLSGCVTGVSDAGGPSACPPVVEYSREFQARAAEELALLPGGSTIAQMLADYAVMREHASVYR